MFGRRRVLGAPVAGSVAGWVWPTLASSFFLLLLAGCAGGEEAVTTTTTFPPSTTTTPVAPSTSATDLVTTSTIAATTSTTIEERSFEIRVESGAVVGGAGELRVDLGSEVRLVVVADVVDHLHVHGYDLFFDLSPGEEMAIEFVADVPGVFEVELEGAGLLLLELEVS